MNLKRFIPLFKAVVYLPLIGGLTFIIYIVKATIHLGFVPGYDHPDPKDLGYTFLYNLNSGLLEMNCILIPLLGILIIIPVIRQFFRVSRFDVIMFITGSLMFIYLYFISSFGEWFFD